LVNRGLKAQQVAPDYLRIDCEMRADATNDSFVVLGESPAHSPEVGENGTEPIVASLGVGSRPERVDRRFPGRY
jgi:hypothetical protein